MKTAPLPAQKRTFIFSGSMFKYEGRVAQLAAQVLHPKFDVVVVINAKLEKQAQLLTTVAQTLNRRQHQVKIWIPRNV